MKKRVLILNGHPDPAPERYCAALVDAYKNGAHSAGHQVRLLNVGEMSFDFLRTAAAFGEAPRDSDIVGARDEYSGQNIWCSSSLYGWEALQPY